MPVRDTKGQRARSLDSSISLLSVVRDHIAENIAPDVDKARRYDVLMVLAALDIVLRELLDGDPTLDRAVGALSDLYSDNKKTNENNNLEHLFHLLSSLIAKEIRQGLHDGAPTVHRQLMICAEALLEEANPKYLARARA